MSLAVWWQTIGSSMTSAHFFMDWNSSWSSMASSRLPARYIIAVFVDLNLGATPWIESFYRAAIDWQHKLQMRLCASHRFQDSNSTNRSDAAMSGLRTCSIHIKSLKTKTARTDTASWSWSQQLCIWQSITSNTDQYSFVTGLRRPAIGVDVQLRLWSPKV